MDLKTYIFVYIFFLLNICFCDIVITPDELESLEDFSNEFNLQWNFDTICHNNKGFKCRDDYYEMYDIIFQI